MAERDESSAPRATLERRLLDDEARLARDEAVMAADEARLLEDERRLEADERATRLARRLSIISVGLAAALAIATAGLVVSVLALREDVTTISGSAPHNSVATGAIQDAAVTADKLAEGSVTSAAVSPGAIGGSALGAGAVTTQHVRNDSLTGADIRESTLSTVPAAQKSGSAEDAKQLGSRPPGAYLRSIQTIQASSPTDVTATKGPVAARCPEGKRVVSGGATVEGLVRDVAIVRSAPDGWAAWVAAANGPRDATEAWRLVVTAICATGGS